MFGLTFGERRERPHLRRVNVRLDVDLRDSGVQRVEGRERASPAAGAPVVVEVIGEDHALVGGQLAEREPGLLGGDGGRETDRELELARQFEVHVEELGSQRDRREVRGEVGRIDAPGDGALDLGAQLAQHLGRIGVLPEVARVAWEATFARQQ